MADTRIRYPGDDIHRNIVIASQGLAAGIADMFNIDPLILGGRVSVIDPEKRTDLHPFSRRKPLLPTIRSEQQDLAGAKKMGGLKVQIGESAGLRADCRRPLPTTNHQRRSAKQVTGGVDPFFGKEQHGAGALDHLLGATDAGLETVLLADQHRRHFGGIGNAVGGAGERSPTGKRPLHKGIDIIDPADGDNPESAEVRTDDQRLGVGVADHSDALAPMKPGQFGFELRPKITVFDIVNGSMKAMGVAYGHAAAPGPQMGMVVGAVIQIRHAIRLRDDAEKSPHAPLSWYVVATRSTVGAVDGFDSVSIPLPRPYRYCVVTAEAPAAMPCREPTKNCR
jgi:hypothetical protein